MSLGYALQWVYIFLTVLWYNLKFSLLNTWHRLMWSSFLLYENIFQKINCKKITCKMIILRKITCINKCLCCTVCLTKARYADLFYFSSFKKTVFLVYIIFLFGEDVAYWKCWRVDVLSETVPCNQLTGPLTHPPPCRLLFRVPAFH